MGYWFFQQFNIKHQICDARSGPGITMIFFAFPPARHAMPQGEAGRWKGKNPNPSPRERVI
jgi:hypothetical protein